MQWGNSTALKLHLVLIMKLPVITVLMTSHPMPVWTEWKSACGKCPEKHSAEDRDSKEPKVHLEAPQLKTIKSALCNYKEGGSLLLGAAGGFSFHVHWRHLAVFFSVLGYENMPHCSDKTDCNVATKQIRVQSTDSTVQFVLSTTSQY